MNGDRQRLSFKVTESQVGKRLDVVLTECLKEVAESEEGLDRVPTRTKVAEWITAGEVQVDQRSVRKVSERMQLGQMISMVIPPPEPIHVEPDSSVSISVIYEDEHLLVLNKQAGISVHPGAGDRERTLVHGLLAYLGDQMLTVGDSARPGLVHRLDKDTTGALVVAKHEHAYQALVRQFVPPRTIARRYLALCPRAPRDGLLADQGRIDAPLGRHPQNRKKMAVVPGGKPSISRWSIERCLTNAVLLKIELETGRTHQIRVHLAHGNAPIIGDPLYGPPIQSLPHTVRNRVLAFGRQALHAAELSFIHPATNNRMNFLAPLPADFEQLIEAFSG